MDGPPMMGTEPPPLHGTVPIDMHQPTPLDVMSEQFKQRGLTAEYKRRRPDGSLAEASESELNVLKAQAHVASTAQALQHLEVSEKTAWALDLKDLANELYARGMIKEAMNRYLEALAATDFDEQTGNVDVLVIPVLCNLAACCIQTQAYRKGALFCDQALGYRPRCLKALMRKGTCLLHQGEFDDAVKVLAQAKAVADEAAGEVREVLERARAAGPAAAAAAAAGPDADAAATTSAAAAAAGTTTDGTTGSKHTEPTEAGAEAGAEAEDAEGGGEGEEGEWSEEEAAAWQLEQLTGSAGKIAALLVRAQKGLAQQRSAALAQKKAMQRVFGGPAAGPAASGRADADGGDATATAPRGEGRTHALGAWLQRLWLALVAWLVAALGLRKNTKTS